MKQKYKKKQQNRMNDKKLIDKLTFYDGFLESLAKNGELILKNSTIQHLKMLREYIIETKIKIKEKLSNEDGTVDRFYLFTIEEKASILQSLKDEKENWEERSPEHKEGYISKRLTKLMIGVGKSIKNV